MFDILRGDLGPSYRYKDHDVNFYIFESLPNSMILGVIAISISVLFGISSGILAAVKQNTWADYPRDGLCHCGDIGPAVRHWTGASICIRGETPMGSHQRMVHRRRELDHYHPAGDNPFCRELRNHCTSDPFEYARDA